MHQPTFEHFQAMKRILRYLQGTLHEGLFISKSSTSSLMAYSDADWAGNPDDRKSTGGYLIYLGNNLLAWNSRKQQTVALSSTELEFKSVADVNVQLKWLTSLLADLHVNLSTPPHIWCDNVGVVFLSTNPVFHARTRHVEVDYHFVRQRVFNKQLTVSPLSSKDQIADIMTKPLARFLFHHFKVKLRLLASSPLACGGVLAN